MLCCNSITIIPIYEVAALYILSSRTALSDSLFLVRKILPSVCQSSLIDEVKLFHTLGRFVSF